MARTPSKSTLTPLEKSIIKALLLDGWRNQDIHAVINTGRPASINFGRISSIKRDQTIAAASTEQVGAFRHKKLMFDHVTGLCPFDDERLVRAREAMILAVELFNTPRIAFKAGVFSILTNVAWTYLLHHYYASKGIPIINKEGFSLLLSQMIARDDCPLSKGCRNNLNAIREIRDTTEHRTIGVFDRRWLPLFQATCLNFDKALTDLYGPRLTLGHDLGFSLQFAKLTTEGLATVQGFEVPEHIAALDASLASKIREDDRDDLDYEFKVIYTLTNASKANAHFQFIQPDSAEGKDIRNVLIKYKSFEDLYPFKPSEVPKLVSNKSGREFSSDKHQRAWKMFRIRPGSNAADPIRTDKKYCVYHALYKSYTYSQAWIDFVVDEIADEETWRKLCAFRE